MNIQRHAHRVISLAIATALAGCGGGGGGFVGVGVGGGNQPPPTPPPPPPIANTAYTVSGNSPFANGCDGGANNGTLYVNAEVEPYVSVDPTNSQHLVGVWQQDRWSGGGSRGLGSAASFDGGKNWTKTTLPVSLCGGGTSANHGNYPFASDPWVSFGPTGIVYAISLSFGVPVSGGTNSAILATRSLDGGKTWQAPSTLIVDGSAFGNDKESITADPNDPSLVYAVWDRLDSSNDGPAYFARSTNSGTTWETAKPIFDPGPNAQTLGNEIVVLPDGTLVDLFAYLANLPSGQQIATAAVIRSTDHGVTWSSPISIDDMYPVGAFDPETGASVRDGADLPQIAVAPNGTLFATWADARFTNGNHDSIALSQSSDGGKTWSAPVAINAYDTAEAFEPSIHVRQDGTISVTYYDFRNNTSDPNTLPTLLWHTRSTDAVHWTENAVFGPFDLDTAPNARGLFLGDYQGLTSMGNVTEPFFVATNSGNTNNRTDVFSAPQTVVTTMLNLMARTLSVTSRPAPTTPPSKQLVQRVSANLARIKALHRAETHVQASGHFVPKPAPTFHL